MGPEHVPSSCELLVVSVMGCFSATQLGISEIWKALKAWKQRVSGAASAHALRLPSTVVQVFKVLASSEKYIKIGKLCLKGKMPPKSCQQFLGGF